MSNQTDNRYASAEVYDQRAKEYDAWFENNPLFASELVALQNIRRNIASPALEIGIGPGRFAQSLGIQFGIDPAFSPLVLAKERGLSTCRAVGESLPFIDNAFSAVYILFTECFLEDPVLVFRECSRVLGKSGVLIVGMVPAESEWGKNLAEKEATGNPFYRSARFSTVEKLKTMLAECGFQAIESVSTLYQNPENKPYPEKPRKGFSEKAGFVILVNISTAGENRLAPTTNMAACH